MPQGRKVFSVPVPIDEAWAFLSSMERVGSCVPGCEEVRLMDERRSRWQVRAEFGPFKRLLDMEATTTRFDPPEHGAFLARGRDMETRGTIDLRALSERETEVTYTVEARALGMMRSLVESAIALVIQDQANQFGANVQAALSPQHTEATT